MMSNIEFYGWFEEVAERDRRDADEEAWEHKQAEIEQLKSALQDFVTSYDDWLGRQDGSPTIDIAENARKLLRG
jgi:hypothetical protein